jgi:hypothetical protein
MEYLSGIVIATLVALSAQIVGLDKDRAFYPTLLVIVASYNGLFAVMSGSVPVLLGEAALILVFLAATYLGFKRNLWIVVAALIGHGILDCFHGLLFNNPGVPSWWPMFCATYDVVAGLVLAWLLYRKRIAAFPITRKLNHGVV